ncbi:MAG: EAL domain-containing protein [Rhodoferax sp.]|nr:EAL domain-containing protein [Rhodoferax sp.]
MHALVIALKSQTSPFDLRLFERALEASPYAFSIADMQRADQPLVYVNHAFELLTGYSRAEVLGRNCRFLQRIGLDTASVERMRSALRDGERVMVTVRNTRKDGGEFLNELFLEPILDDSGTLTHFVGLQSDVSERDRRRGDARSSAASRRGHGLPGREALEDRIEQSLARALSLGSRCALFQIELSFPAHAGPLGDMRGRTRLYEVAQTIGESVPEVGSSLSRLHDNRLALLLDPAPESGQLADIARRVLSGVQRQLALGEDGSTCHIGIAVGPSDGSSAQELTVAAGRAIERARLRSPAGDLSFFANGQDARMLHQRQMESDLIDAIECQQFTLVFQPIVHLETATLAGFEALIRWTHPVRGPIPPSEFIPVAEANGMIAPISDWVIERALSQLAAFDRVGGLPMRMFINIAASQFESVGFIDKLRAQLLHHGVPGSRVELEITERMVADHNPATLQTMQALRSLGISIAIDDFGTGYSNLHNLTQLSIDTLKVDMSFTQAVTHSAAAASVSRMISELGRTLDLHVVVEGIETAGQLNHFRSLGCAFGQGYLFSKPLAADAACELLCSDAPLFIVHKPEDELHLLLLDDEENILSALRRVLRREGYRVHTTTSPMEAYEILATHPIGVVLSDQRMPRMNGTEFLQQVKRLYPLTVRMVLSGYSELQTVQDAVNKGSIWRFLSKPWNDDALRDQIRLAFLEHSALRSTAQQRASAVVAQARLERALTQRDERLALEGRAVESARDALSMLPIPVLGVDSSNMVVMSNLAADRLFGGGASLVGGALPALAQPGFERAVASKLPVPLRAGNRPFLLHVQVWDDAESGQGHMLCLVPGSGS